MYKNLILITAVASLTITSQVFLKKGLKLIGEFKLNDLYNFGFVIKLLQNKFIIIGVLIAIVGALFWLTVISRIDLTIAFPISSGIFFILLFLISWIFLGESITSIKIIGMTIILFGIYLISCN